MPRSRSRQNFVDTTGKYGSPKAGPPVWKPRQRVPTGGPGQAGRGSTGRPRPPAGQLPKTLPVSPKTWITLGRGLAGRLLGGVGTALIPKPVADATFDGVRYGRPRARPVSSVPGRDASKFANKRVGLEFRGKLPTKDFQGGTGTGNAGTGKAGTGKAVRGRRGGKLPRPAVERSLRRAKSDKDLFRIPKRDFLEVADTVVSKKLDEALDRPKSPSVLEKPEISTRKLERIERRRKARRERKRSPKPDAVPKPAVTRPKPAPKPVTKPKPSTTKPKPSTKPSRGTGGAQPPVSPKPKPAVKPGVKVPQPKPNPGSSVSKPKPAAPKPKPVPGKGPGTGSGPAPKPGTGTVTPAPETPTVPDTRPRYPEVIMEPAPDGSGVRLRTRQVRAAAKPKRAKDQKARGRKAELLHRFVTTSWGAYTEWQDLWDVIRGNLYVERKGKAVYADQLDMTDREVVRAWFEGELQMDIDGFLVDFTVNQIEDAVIGRLSSSLNKAIIKAGLNPGEITIAQRLNALRRTRAQGDF